MLKLVIFDFDGVLVDTELTTFNFYKELLPKYNIFLKDSDFQYKIGQKSIDFFKNALGKKFDERLVQEITLVKRKAFIEDVKKYLTPIPGMFELLELCQKEGLKMAIGSQNEKELIQKALDEFRIRKYFSFTTSLQDIKNKKPDPEVYLLVTSKLGINPKDAIVIEDAPQGIEGAIKGGFKSVGVMTAFSEKELNEADLVVRDLTQLSPAILKNLNSK